MRGFVFYHARYARVFLPCSVALRVVRLNLVLGQSVFGPIFFCPGRREIPHNPAAKFCWRNGAFLYA